jgi:cytochrome P450
MLASSQPIVPPAPKVHERDLPGLWLLFEFSRNTVAAQPNNAFDDLIVRRRILGIESLLLNDPEGVRHVLTTAMDKYKRPVAASRILSALGGSGLFLAERAQWRLQRRMLAPLFTPANVDILLPHFMVAAAGLATRLNGSPRANLALAFQETALDAVLRALFSLPDSEQRARIAAMVRRYLAGPGRPSVLDGIARTEQSFGFAMRSRRRFHKTWSETIDAIIAARRKSPNPAAGGDLLDLLIAARDSQSGEALSETEVRDQCSTMLVAGYETTARLLFWSVYLLTLDLKEQTNLRPELAAFPPERVQKLDDVQHWPRLRQTLLEALRLYPPVASLRARPSPMTSLPVNQSGLARKYGSVRGSSIATANSGTIRPHSYPSASQERLRIGPTMARSFPSAPDPASASGQHLRWPKRRSCWRRSCRASKSLWRTVTQCFRWRE